jgi:monoamine oxidase
MREARRLGIETRLWRGWTHFEVWRDGQPHSQAYHQERSTGYEAFWRRIASLGEDFSDRSIADIAATLTEAQQGAIAALSRLGLGEEPSRLSVHDYMSQAEGPDHIVPAGYGTLVSAAAQDLPIQLNQVVRRITAERRGFTVATDEATLSARAVVVTVPIGVLKSGLIRFEPGLPLYFNQALDGLGMGALTKLVLAFDGERFGVAPGDDKIILDAPGGAMTFECWPYDRNIIIAVTGGDGGRGLSTIGERDAIELVSTLWSSIVGTDCRRHLTGGRLAAWWGDPYAEGGYATVKPGHFSARETLLNSGIDGLYFAGEATAAGRLEATMTVAGASYAGWDAAKRAIAEIRG